MWSKKSMSGEGILVALVELFKMLHCNRFLKPEFC